MKNAFPLFEMAFYAPMRQRSVTMDELDGMLTELAGYQEYLHRSAAYDLLVGIQANNLSSIRLDPAAMAQNCPDYQVKIDRVLEFVCKQIPDGFFLLLVVFGLSQFGQVVEVVEQGSYSRILYALSTRGLATKSYFNAAYIARLLNRLPDEWFMDSAELDTEHIDFIADAIGAQRYANACINSEVKRRLIARDLEL